MYLIRPIAALALVSSAAAAAPSTNNTSDAAPKEERKICRTFAETGSLVKRVKVCKTASQWAADSAMLRQSSGVNSCAMQPCDVPGK
jgi:hypothetical protein